MRIAFLLTVLGGAIFYTYIAFTDLGFMTRTGRLGPGFFPRVVGLGIVVFTLWALFDALRDARLSAQGAAVTGPGDAHSTGRWRDAATLMGLAVGYGILLPIFGGFVATVIYMLIALSIINSGKHLLNVILAIVIPAGVYLLFDRILNASMPPAMFDIIPF
ncbi:tripartite tricarboxylate transporter TctB family protein [Roseicyclus mahoneyensis]|uniref:Tripartite tricarboxylate transporter TctB family protein n=1 Tax=Roseicyclus mahoneyensis TaxID=164332 RepID=A0A316GQ30_9RHOB|nr:tripartite tricarboxylate transporter TctB family protein [Roseicyclus mahoneyensis]PWK62511.1 tripartite tricarboxylate transporter TctB family protein [Roseicyclus mahoneyensis]